ncbi:MAG: fibronectin type III domain-containing protein, partial [Elusimicrobiota bacterium]
GGKGGGTSGAAGGAAYDDAMDPVLPGSGGGGARLAAAVGGAGGGVVILRASSMTINGLIIADGGGGGNSAGAGGGGAGGAINLRADYFDGAGIVTSSGGYGGYGTGSGGGGGGGLISVRVDVSGSACDLIYNVRGGTTAATAGVDGVVSTTNTLAGPENLLAANPTTDSLDWSWSLSLGAKDYRLFSSTGTSGQSPMSPALGIDNHYTTSGLLPNTTAAFYVRTSGCGAFADSAVYESATLAAAPAAAAQTWQEVNATSMTVSWAANGNPVDMTTYTVVLTTGVTYPNTYAGNVSASTLPAGSDLSLTLAGLYNNTTYHLFVSAVNHAGIETAYVELASASTLAKPPQALESAFLHVFYTSATLAWAARPAAPPEASSNTCEGYVLEGSSTNFSALLPGGDIISSVTYQVRASTLTLPGLDLGNTYYFRVGALNHNGRPAYADLPRLNFQIMASSEGLSLGSLDALLHTSTVSISSIVVTNVGNLPVTLGVWGTLATPLGSPWTLGTSPGLERVLLQGIWNSEPPPPPGAFVTPITASTVTSGGAGGNYAGDQAGASVPPGESRTLWFRFWRPTSTVSMSKERIEVGVRALYP